MSPDRTPFPPSRTKPAVRERGRFITFEGGEGSGKSTQVNRLVAHLAEQGIETVATREPGGSPHAERLRRLLLSGAIAPLGAKAEALVFAAARIDHIDATIEPALAEGCYVVCDRFADSTRAYQGATGKVDMQLVRELELVATSGLKPDLTIILDIPATDGLARAKGRGAGVDRFEAEDLAFHEAVRQSFLETAKAEPTRCLVIDARQPLDAIAAQIWTAVTQRFMKKTTETPRAAGQRQPATGSAPAAAKPRKPASKTPSGKSSDKASKSVIQSGQPAKAAVKAKPPAKGDAT